MARKPGPPPFNPNEHEIKEVEMFAGLGLTKYLIQNYFGVNKDTWLKAEKRNPELKKAFKKGQAKTIARVAGKLYDKIMAGDLKAIMFYLRTRAGWSDKYDPEADCNIFEPVVSINATDPTEAAKIYQQIMRGGSKK